MSSSTNEITVVYTPQRVDVVVDANGVVVASPGPQGPVGPQGPAGAAGGAIFVFTQASPATPWVINHNLGFYPDVSVVVAGEEVDADVVHGSTNQTTISFGSPQSGEARLRP